MFFSGDVINLALFCAQQFGVAVGVGAQTVMMVAYWQAMRDGMVDDNEAQFLRATRRVSFFALGIIIVSGLAITVLHAASGDLAVVFSPAYLFKWLLIIVVTTLTSFAGSIPRHYFEMLIAANWYALFMVHTLAPVTTWLNLFELWAVWLVGFALVWYAVTAATHERKHIAEPVPGVPAAFAGKQQVKSAPSAPPAPKPEESKIKLEERPVIQMPRELVTPKPVVALPQAASPIKFIPQQPLSITPTEIPMPAGVTTDTPFLPKVPPLLPIPTPVPTPGAAAGVPKAPDAAPQLQKPEEVAAEKPAASSLGINVMPKSPDQLPK